ncbi:MAG: hypothetical protein HY909_09880 [Deltaproteobacteria bacterium]|nr:hypothetical protein [Deltaproteobacteria bacterium]
MLCALLGLLLGALAGCPHLPSCGVGTPVCQHGSIHGTRCVCEPPGRYPNP